MTDEGLKAFFEPVKSDMYVCFVIFLVPRGRSAACFAPALCSFVFLSSLSCQIILRGTRSAGYGFVALATEEAAQKAVEALNGKDLEGRTAIVEIAKPADQKDKERAERKAKRRVSRRGSKPVPGEVSEAEANGEAPKATANTTDAEGDEAKPKKKKKAVRSPSPRFIELLLTSVVEEAQPQGQGCCCHGRKRRRRWC